MKKLLAIAIIATAFVACNNGETKTEEKTADSTNTTVVTPAPDTTKPATPDTTKMMAKPDSTKK